MSEATATTTTETTTPPAKSKRLDELHAEFVARKTPCTPKEGKALMAAYRTARDKREALERQIADALAAESKAAEDVVRARGKGRFTTSEGETFTPMVSAKGGTVFLRNDSPKELPSFG